jgi:hypothetical protein
MVRKRLEAGYAYAVTEGTEKEETEGGREGDGENGITAEKQSNGDERRRSGHK